MQAPRCGLVVIVVLLVLVPAAVHAGLDDCSSLPCTCQGDEEPVDLKHIQLACDDIEQKLKDAKKFGCYNLTCADGTPDLMVRNITKGEVNDILSSGDSKSRFPFWAGIIIAVGVVVIGASIAAGIYFYKKRKPEYSARHDYMF